MNLEDFFTPAQQDAITAAIAGAERKCSGEIRVHLTPRCRFSPVKAARRVFNRLKMYQTRQRNAVLVYLAPMSRKLAIIGDSAINERVDKNYWNEEVRILAKALSQGQYAEGIIEAVERIGRKLAEHFPPEADDQNELSNEISYEP